MVGLIRLFGIVVISVYLVGCSPKLRSSITNAQPKFDAASEVVVLPLDDNQNLNGILVGELRSSDNGLSTDCTYPQVIELLKDMARENGANVIKLVKNKQPDHWSTCVRVKAVAYRVTNPREYEVEINWSADRKLSWADFKADPATRPNSLFDAESYYTINYQTNFVTLLTRPKVFVTNTFNCQKSWVDEGKKSDAILKHEQGHFDLCEIYTRKLRVAFDKLNLTPSSMHKLEPTFKEFENEYNVAQMRYDSETVHGSNAEAQKRWESYIALTLGI